MCIELGGECDGIEAFARRLGSRAKVIALLINTSNLFQPGALNSHFDWS